jgi:hypothetical protein
MPSVFSLANIEQGEIYYSSFIQYKKVCAVKVDILLSTFHHNTLAPVQPSYHKFKEEEDLVTGPNVEQHTRPPFLLICSVRTLPCHFRDAM